MAARLTDVSAANWRACTLAVDISDARNALADDPEVRGGLCLADGGDGVHNRRTCGAVRAGGAHTGRVTDLAGFAVAQVIRGTLTALVFRAKLSGRAVAGVRVRRVRNAE